MVDCSIIESLACTFARLFSCSALVCPQDSFQMWPCTGFEAGWS